MLSLFDTFTETREITPLIVCGVARSGTRMATDILNAHERIVVQDEIHAKTMEAYFDFIEQIQGTFDHYSERKGRPLHGHWQRNREALHHMFFISANKKQMASKDESILYHGVKTPGYERYLEQFETCFPRHPPHYVYCMRDAAKVWRSWQAIGYLDNVRTFTSRYERSLRQALAIKQQVGDRLIVFELDAMLNATDKFAFIEKTFYKPLGLTMNASAREQLDATENRNSAKRRGVVLADDGKMIKQMEKLSQSRKIRDFKAALLDRS